jgi:hypothetical protein
MAYYQAQIKDLLQDILQQVLYSEASDKFRLVILLIALRSRRLISILLNMAINGRGRP